MSNVLIAYGSTTGNTEYVAERVERLIADAGHSVTLLNAADASAENLAANYDAVLFGCSTWGDEEIELQDDFIPLYDDLDSAALSGKKIACFGCGDSSYTYFCGAVDAIEERAKDNGATIFTDSLKIDDDPRSENSAIDEWANQIIGAL